MTFGASPSVTTSDPCASLFSLVSQEGLHADLLLCPGDLGNKAEPGAVKYAWDFVNRLGIALKVKHTVGTAGNHDVDSRHQYNKFDAKGVLQTLAPPFPVSSEADFHHYWSRHFAILKGTQWRLVTLNSSAFHGAGADEKEYEHGRISEYTLEALERALSSEQASDLNILLCHHHPHQHSELGLGEQDVMKGGQLLLDLLGNSRHGDWFVIHGHKHHPKISYASGTHASTPVVFAAGSLSAILYSQLQTQARNQFYVLEFDTDEIKVRGLVGKFRAWDWAVGLGWIPATQRSGLPAFGGFGNRTASRLIANEIANAAKVQSVLWSEICNSCPLASYLLPPDEEAVEHHLRTEHKRKLLRGPHGQIERIEELS